ncbi:hypothetical protein IVB55_05695 [Bradyrhizobium sp. CW4]|uniref:hypothetical protein n=1 Tax=Bradyrhizobium sp. CW4 TaxID=2782687 RepID=UPI001FF79CFC|nr:hypothetical protein [Bradyrhizobium sp. CW4]MCK1412522.1 hypothetical protein [Bradyrhizobium sp. CW4]
MTVTTRIHCLTDAEPASFHGSDNMGYAVNLNVECESDSAFDKAARDQAHDAFRLFLKQAAAVDFYLFKATYGPLPNQAGKTGVLSLNLVYKVGDQDSHGAVKSEPNPADADLLIAWLDEGAHARTNEADEWRYWLVKPVGNDVQPIDEADIGATHELRSAHAWNAPVAHRFGLTKLLLLPPADIDPQGRREFYLVLPSFDGNAPAPDRTRIAPFDGAEPPATLDIPYDLNAAFEAPTVCRAAQLLPPASAFPGLVRPDGFLNVDEQPDQVRRLLNWFERGAVTLMSPEPGLARDSEPVQALFKPAWFVTGPDSNRVYEVEAFNAAWRLVASLCIALDPLIVGLMRPALADQVAPELRPEGQVLSVLVSAILQRLDDARSDDSTVFPDGKLPNGGVVAGAVRDFLQGNALFGTDTERFSSALRYVHGIAKPSDGSGSMDDVLLDVLVECYKKGAGQRYTLDKAKWDKIRAVDPKTNEERFALEPLTLAAASGKKLHEESGFEAAILRFFEVVIVDPKDPQPPGPIPFGEALAKPVANKTGLDVNKITTPVTKAWQDFRALLGGAFDGVEAARRSAASDYLIALLGPQGSEPLKVKGDTNTLSSLIKLINDGSSFSDSLFNSGNGCFAGIVKSLPRPKTPTQISTNASFLNVLAQAHGDALAPSLHFDQDGVRFVPDSVPHPLPVQIGDSLKAGDVDEFAHHFNGIAIAIRRVDKAVSSFAHLNLAGLTWSRTVIDHIPQFASKADENGAIHPILPASVDGRSAVFLNYEGFPLASTAFSETVPYIDQQGRSARRPFYIHDVAEYEGEWLNRMPPQLAYGRTFETFSFITTNSGSMPTVLRKASATPWRPAKDIPADQIKGEVISKAPCQRRTAIGRIALAEQAGNKGGAGSARIGGALPGVYPLANDYPRLVIAANRKAAPGTLALMRLSDGSGGFLFPTEAGEVHRAKLTLAEPDWVGGKGKLGISLYTAPTRLDTDADVAIPDVSGAGPGFDGTGELFLSVELVTPSADGNTYVLRLYVDRTVLGEVQFVSEPDRGWFRFMLKPEEDKPVVFSFAEPDGQGNAHHGIRDTPLLLLAPEDPGWQSGLAKPVHARIAAPRTGFLDFERWFANADLVADVFPGDTRKQAFFDALLTAYVMRHRDKDIAESLANLPDPSVVALRVTLAISDRLGSQSAVMLQEDLDLKRLLPLVVEKLPERTKPWSVEDLKAQLFNRLREKFTFVVDVSPGPLSLKIEVDNTNVDRLGGTISAQVPKGSVAQLSFAPLVGAMHFLTSQRGGLTFPEVFHPGMLQYVVANSGSMLVFPETALRIETMADVLVDRKRATDLAARMIGVTPVESARRYDLTSLGDLGKLSSPQPADGNDWRMIGEVDITTQRWRVSGRPIYNYVNPREFRGDVSGDEPENHPVLHPALVLKNPANRGDALSVFETEAFFDRLNLDSETVSQRLLPLPSSTVLQSFLWGDASATYFRHHFRLRSRYAGALTREDRCSVAAWPEPDRKTPDPVQEWTLRVAMLADHSKLTVTRPQLRALIPLTTSAGVAATSASTPPVLAVLQEPPFARSGLADRTVAEMSTGFGYGFESDEDQVHILDSRKEVGPDPRLTYRPMPSKTALGLVMRSEGPMGLTFDLPSAPAPAFANSLLSLIPGSVTEEQQPVLQEHFMGIALRRYIDPNWMTVNPLQTGKDILLDPEQASWIELPAAASQDGSYKVILKHGQGQTTVEPLLEIASEKSGMRTIAVAKIMLDPVPAKTGDVELAHFKPSRIQRLVLLHQPVAPKRYSTSILGVPNNGSSQENLPLLLASFEWSPRQIVDSGSQDIPDAVIALDDAVVWPAMASARTFLAWTRTGLDHDRGRVFKITDKQATMEVEPMEFGEIEARVNGSHEFSLRRSNTGDGVPIWAASSTFAEPLLPVHLHRHLAVISTYFADGAGRPVEIFSRADWLRAMTTPLTALDNAKPSRCRVIEFETPAMILTGTPSDAIPTTYRTAYFDLMSIGYQTGRQLQLFFRFVGSPQHLRSFDTLQINFAGADAVTVQTVSIGLAATGFSLGLWLVLSGNAINVSRLNSDGSLSVLKPNEIHVSRVNSNGTQPVPPAQLWAPETPGFILSIKATKGGVSPAGLEFWADVSLLHSKGAGASGDFDFEWLFSPSFAGDAPDAVRPQVLSAMTEAQARIIAVSPPIPLFTAGT